MAVKKKLTLKVLFDTNVIYTGSANDLFRKEITELLDNHKILSDIELYWHIPEVVLKERTFQMNKKGNELLPNVQKLERILGHNLNISSEIIRSRIDETIKKQLEKYQIHTAKTDTTKVDWETLINKALNRQPPFEDNEKEKGFRDALILECLMQLIKNSPTTKSICRIAFISNDGLLNVAATQATSSASNVNVFSNIDELVSLINILTSQITEETITSISAESGKLFFTKDDETSLYFTEGVRKKITEDYATQLSAKQEGADKRENGSWWINKPGFEKKDKQRVFWKSIIEVDFEEFKTSIESSSTKSILDLIQKKESTNPFLSTSAPSFQTKKEKVGEGKTRFEVLWSVTLTTNKKLKNPKVDSIKYVDTIPK
jgi:hypothetical protein